MKYPFFPRWTVEVFLGLALAFPWWAHAQTPLSPNPNSGFIDVYGAVYSDGFVNNGEIRNHGSLQSYNYFNNVGTVSNQSNGQLDIYGSFSNANGSALHNYSNGQIRNHGALTIDSLSETISYGQLKNTGTFLNGGYLQNFGGLSNEGIGTMTNHGVLKTSGVLVNDGRNFENFGSLQFAGGEFRNLTDAVNKGQMFSDGFSKFENLGRFDNQSYLFTDYNATINNSGNLINNGQIQSWGTTNNRAVFTNQAGTVENHGVFLNGSYGSTDRLDNFDRFQNYGTLTNQTTLNNWSRLENFGNLENDSELNNQGILTNGGTLLNFGNLSNGVAGSSGQLINRGTIDNRNRITNDVTGTLTNEGLIKNSGSGIMENRGLLDNRGDIRSDGNSLISNLGTLKNYRLILIGENGSSSTLENRGTLDNLGILSNAGSGAIVNYGTLNNGPYSLTGTPVRLENFGTLYNFGNLNNFSSMESYGSVKNSASFANYGTLSGFGGWYEQAAGTTLNHGSMSQEMFAISGGELRGSGTLNGTVRLGSGVQVKAESFSDSTGTMTVNGDLYSQADYLFELGGTAIGDFDQFQVNGNVFFWGGKFSFSFVDGYLAQAGDAWQFMRAGSFTDWSLVTWDVTGLADGLTYEYGFTDNYAYLKLSSVSITPVPEPTSYAMLLAGLGLVGTVVRHRRARAVGSLIL